MIPLQVTLGKTGITVDKNGFGALPVQRVGRREAVYLLRKAFEHGITFFDTARSYSDSEEKLGCAFRNLREKIFIATKTPATTATGFWDDLHTSLRLLHCDYVDILQFHNPAFCPKPGDGSGLYEAMQEARQQGKIRFIGLTNHRLPVAREAVDSGLYDTLQFPFSYLATPEEHQLAARCRERQIGFLAMKALAGGLITDAMTAYAYLAQFDHVLPLWGIQRERELNEFLACRSTPPALDAVRQAVIDRDRRMLQGNFCRGCGYCLPCPAGIEINTCARMSLLIRRAPSAAQLTAPMQAMMKRIESCLHCGRCAERCPYHLDTPALLQANYQDYREILAGKPV
ncbi:aldo/keto reductase [Victivallis sp. Marseille-Q1083]|uniref:aldo/keto reductase n=1 Tax=Victivallis sp. Marseille-Q1083 TaxID=2717288 RepID=UPI0015886126|nr:aldo/keto reductase [Victivallis sp. Marseille-Q1083]